MNTRFFITTCCILLISFAFAQRQSLSEIEKEKEALLQKIGDAKNILGEVKSQKTNTIGELNAIKHQISVRRSYINLLEKEIKVMNNNIAETDEIITSLSSDLDSLKQEYARMIYESSKTSSQQNQVAYLFSAESYNELSLRMNYLNQMKEARRNQVEKIKSVRDHLVEQEKSLKEKRDKKAAALANISREKNKLDNLKSNQNQVISELNKKESEIKKNIKQWEDDQKRLEALVKEIIREQQEAQKAKTAAEKNLIERIDTEMSNSFEANKNRLLWPVKKCFISRRFGPQPHPTIQGVSQNNLGLGLQTERNAEVRAVFDGEVVSVANIPGMNSMVMIKHGEYYTVYAKMKTIVVKAGQKVTAKTVLGQVSTNDGISELEFQIWKNNIKLNPEHWLHR